MFIGRREFHLPENSYIMGILNVTPDSFSDGGRWSAVDAALKHSEQMIKEGASILDVGGESTRPGHQEVSAREEIDRVLPVIRALKKNFDIPVSLDTWKYQVAEAGIKEGVDLINDIWGLRRDHGQMARLLADSHIPCCLMHNRDTVNDSDHENFLADFRSEIGMILKTADKAGILREHIILDPGIGFGKTYEQNLLLLKHLSVMKEWNLPVLLGTSRKSVIGNALNLPVDQREEGTLVTTVMGRLAGACIFRVHDVKSNYRALKMTDQINGRG